MAISAAIIKSFQLSALATALALAGCGGGGGGNDTLQPEIGRGTNGNDGGTTTNSSVKITNISLVNANGAVTSTISSSGANAIVKVTDGTGKGISGVIVTFTATGGVTFGTSNGAVLTNANGEASISVKPTDATDTGAYSLSATASYNDTTATTPAYNFSLQPVNITLSNFAASSNSLMSGGSTNITLVTNDATSNSAQNNVAVNFTATCGTFTNSSVTSSNQGNVTTTYKAIDANGNLCEGSQTITATTASGNVSKTINLTVAAIQANSIIYTSTDNVALVTRGSGSATSGTIEFTVYSNGTPAANQSVNINLTRAPSDLSLSSSSLTQQTILTSDSSGKVIVRLYPGTLPGPVEVTATLTSDSKVFATSKNVSIATGRVYQNGLSLSAEKSSMKGWVDGDSSKITARMVDRVGNPVPDGTVISFVAEGGSITPSCSSSNGSCTVTFSVQNPRPADGRVSVLAYVEGDKAYTDTNGNNMWDSGEPFQNNIGDLFRDDNENGLYDAGEFIYKRGETGTCGNSSFRYPNIPGTCGTSLSAILRYEMPFTWSNKTPTIVNLSNPLARPSTTTTTFTKDFSLFGNSEMTIPLASGTTVAFTTADNTKDNNLTCTVEMRTGVAQVPDLPDSSTPYYTASFKECDADDDFKLTITPPGEQPQTFTYTLK